MALKKTVYYWDLPKDHPDFSGHDDLPEAYMVDQDEDCTGGVIVHAKFNGEWDTNPWNTRTLIRQLLIELGKIKPPATKTQEP